MPVKMLIKKSKGKFVNIECCYICYNEENFTRNCCIDIAFLIGAYFAAGIVVKEFNRSKASPATQ